jgi:Predicted membrane protein (DUF2142)
MSADAIDHDPGRARWRAPPTQILLTVACGTALALVGVAWALASPLGSIHDEDFHLGSIWCKKGDETFCRYTGTQIEEGIERVLVAPELGRMSCWGQSWDASAGCQAAIRERAGRVPGRANDGLYPDGFYRLMAVFASSNIDRSVVVMRIVSWLLALSLLSSAAFLASRDLRRAFTIGAFTTLVPLGVFVFASTNPSGVAIAGVAAYWCATHTFLSVDLTPRRIAAVLALVVAGCVFALASRADAGIFLAVASLAAWISTAGHRRTLLLRSLLPVGVGIVGLAYAFAGTQTQRWAGGLGVQEDNTLAAKLFESALDLPRVALGALGPAELVWTPLPPLVSTLMLVAFGGVVILGIGAASREKWLALAVTVGAIVVASMAVLVSGQNVQARYVLPLLPVVAATALVAPRLGSPVVIGRGQAFLIAGAVVVAHSAALHRTIRRFVTGIDEGGPDLGESVEWWWSAGPGPMAVWLLGTFAFAVATACAFVLVLSGDSSRTDAGELRSTGT